MPDKKRIILQFSTLIFSTFISVLPLIQHLLSVLKTLILVNFDIEEFEAYLVHFPLEKSHFAVSNSQINTKINSFLPEQSNDPILIS